MNALLGEFLLRKSPSDKVLNIFPKEYFQTTLIDSRPGRDTASLSYHTWWESNASASGFDRCPAYFFVIGCIVTHTMNVY